jgi:hypothetical protein
MKTSSVFAATLLLWLIPCMSCAKEREFLGNYPLAFQVGDSNLWWKAPEDIGNKKKKASTKK